MTTVNPSFNSDHKVADLPLHPRLHQRLQTIGVKCLTDIQAACFHPIMSDSDVLIKSQTGSGKTLAYTIPLVQRMTQDWETQSFTREGGTRTLIMVPTRELAVQCLEVVSSVARPFPHFVPGSLTGGEQRHREKARLRQGIVTLICTPGRLVDHLRTTKSFVVSSLQYIVYDEADRILDMGFQKDITFLLEHLKNQGTKVRKSVLASATLDLRVRNLAHITLNNPVLVGYEDAMQTTASAAPNEANAEEVFSRIDPSVELDTDVNVPDELKQHFIVCPCKWRLSTLVGFLRWKLDSHQPNKIIVFLSNVDSVEFHYSLLSTAHLESLSNAPTEEDMREKEERRHKLAQERRRRKKERLKADLLMERQLLGDTKGFEELEMDEEAPEEELTFNEDMLNQNTDTRATLLLPFNMFRLHGNVGQLERVSVYKAFGKCERGVLFCTDVAARGIDFPGVTWIVQYDTPGEERNYIHRIGRTARIGRVGNSLLFLMPHEFQYIKCLQRHNLHPEPMRSKMAMFHMANVLGTPDIGSAGPAVQNAIVKAVLENPAVRQLARLGYQAFVRAYSTHPKRLKAIFHPNELHLGHVASSFGLRSPPTELNSKEFKKVKKDARDAVVKKVARKRELPTEDKKEEYKPAIILKQEKVRKDLAKKKEKKRALQLSTVAEFDSAIVVTPELKRRKKR